VILGRVSRPTRGPVRGMGDGIVGRRRELDALRAWLDTARNRAGRLVLCVGEPGIGKTRLAQELAGVALAGGAAVAWGHCVETEGAPAFWPWRQVLRSLGVDPDTVLTGDVESPADRFRVFDQVTEAVRSFADKGGLVVILDDLHWGDEPSLLVLRHLADQVAGARLLLFAAFRDAEPVSALPRVLPDLLRSSAVERLELRGFDLAEVREQLSRTTADESVADARAVLEVTGGNPLFVREVARAMADGTWRADRPPRTLLDIVSARLDRVSADCRRLVQAAAIVGRDFSLALVAATLDEPVAHCLPLIDEAIAYGLLDRVGDLGEYRFVHALTRDAVEASLTTADRAALHRAVAEATQAQFTGDRRACPGNRRLLRAPVRAGQPRRCHRGGRSVHPAASVGSAAAVQDDGAAPSRLPAPARRAPRPGRSVLPAGGPTRELVAARVRRPARLCVRRPCSRRTRQV
jgi:predicted ATPase